mgnify:CR=1 FL=1
MYGKVWALYFKVLTLNSIFISMIWRGFDHGQMITGVRLKLNLYFVLSWCESVDLTVSGILRQSPFGVLSPEYGPYFCSVFACFSTFDSSSSTSSLILFRLG